MRSFILPVREFQVLRRRAYYYQQSGHREVCGLVATEDGKRITLFYMKNEYQGGAAYSLSHTRVMAAVREVERTGSKVIGTFHSHPISEAKPSVGDIERGFFRRIELIYDVCGVEAKLWWLKRRGPLGAASEIELRIQR